MSRRISFNEQDAAHIYEWLRMYWVDEPGANYRQCLLCDGIGRRLERLLGPRTVRRIVRVVNRPR